jgi:hypothetical protein
MNKEIESDEPIGLIKTLLTSVLMPKQEREVQIFRSGKVHHYRQIEAGFCACALAPVARQLHISGAKFLSP